MQSQILIPSPGRLRTNRHDSREAMQQAVKTVLSAVPIAGASKERNSCLSVSRFHMDYFPYTAFLVDVARRRSFSPVNAII